MSEFKINVAGIDSEMRSLQTVKSDLLVVKSDLAVQIMRLRLAGDSSAAGAIRSKLGVCSKRIGNEITNINNTINTGHTICSKVKNAEIMANKEMGGLSDIAKITWPFIGGRPTNGSVDFGRIAADTLIFNLFTAIGGPLLGCVVVGISHIKPEFDQNGNRRYSEKTIKSDVYNTDGTGMYGSDQGAMVDKLNNKGTPNAKKIYNDLKQYYPNITYKEAVKYMDTLNHHGCTFAAMANTILSEYSGRDEEFEKKFGFPLKDKNGNYNYDRMILDIYDTTYKNGKHNYKDKYGNTPSVHRSTKEILEIEKEYLTEKGVKMGKARTDAKITVDNFEEYSKKGQVVLDIHDVVIYKDDHRQRCGGHAVVVTGVTEDGLFVVSSWGEKYYLDPKELDGNDKFLYIENGWK